MSFLVDTNVLSELAKAKPDARVVAWLRDHEPDLYLSTITIGELRSRLSQIQIIPSFILPSSEIIS